MATPTLSSRIQNRVEGKAIRNEIESDYTAPAVNTEARYVDEKGRKLVEMQENMRTAARFSEIEDTMNKNKIEKSMFESDKNSIGPVQPTPKTQDYSDLYTAAMKTVDFEARKDKDGNPIIYELPAGDMGGKYEVAGINDKYHPEAFKRISALPKEQRKAAAAEYIQGYTAPLVSQLPQAIQPFAQDMAFNRGLGGATKYFQQGLNQLGQKVDVDSGIGPKTLSAMGKVDPQMLMKAATKAQMDDEYRRAAANPDRVPLLPGMSNRTVGRLTTFGQG